MGSRAVALGCRNDAVAAARFGAPDGASGAVYTRTGRPFFNPTLTAQLLESARRGGRSSAGLWDELETRWSCWTPNCCRGAQRPRSCCVPSTPPSVPPRGRRSRSRSTRWNRRSPTGSMSVIFSNARRSRLRNADAFTDAYRRYCWTTNGLDGVRIAPFQLLATEGKTYHDRDHLWHMSSLSRLAVADPELVDCHSSRRGRHHRCRRRSGSHPVVGGDDGGWGRGHGREAAREPDPRRARPRAAGAEGSRPRVPAHHLRPRLHRTCQPRATAPAQPRAQAVARHARVRARDWRHSNGARGEPLWRVHEPVFAVLALESEPVDPRL